MTPKGKNLRSSGKRPLGPFAGAAQPPRHPLLIPLANGGTSLAEMAAMRATAEMALVNHINQLPPDQRGEAVADMHQQMLESRIINAGEMSPDDALCYATIYHALYPIDSTAKIDVTRVKKFVDDVVRKNPAVYEDFRNYFGLDGTSNSIVHVETMQALFTQKIQPEIRRLRTFKNAMIYNPAIEQAVQLVASKVRTSREDVSVLDKALAAFMLYFVLLKDIWYFWLDIEPATHDVTMDRFQQTNKTTFYPEHIIALANKFFAKLPDGDILYDVIIDFIDSYPKKVRNTVYRFAQMDGSEFAEHWTYGRIRREIKGALFPNFCSLALTSVLTISGLQAVDIGSFKNAYYAATKMGYHKLPICKPTKIANALASTFPTGYVMIHKRQFGIAHIDGEDCPQYACSEQELGLNRILYEYLKQNPDICIGTVKKSFTELNMVDWSITVGDVIQKWVLDSQFATCESDINWDLIPHAIDTNSITIGALFMEYFHNCITKEEVLTRLGFSSASDERVLTLAKMVFSKSATTRFTQEYKEYAVLDVHPAIPSYELSLYRSVFNWIRDNLDTDVGVNGSRTLRQEGMSALFFTKEEAMVQMLVELGIVKNSESINAELLSHFINARYFHSSDILSSYFDKHTTAQEVFHSAFGIDFAEGSEMVSIAKMYFSLTSVLDFSKEHVALAQKVQYADEQDEYISCLCRDIYSWICNNADSTDICPNGKSLKKHFGADLLHPSPEVAMTSVILTLGLASSEEDINWELASVIMEKAYGAKARNGESPASTSEILQKYNIGAISANSVLEHLGFAQEAMEANPRIRDLAKMCFSHSGLKLFEAAEMRSALTRHKRFRGQVSVTDKLYYELYLFLAETGTPCGGVGAAVKGVETGSSIAKPISAYGIRY